MPDIVVEAAIAVLFDDRHFGQARHVAEHGMGRLDISELARKDEMFARTYTLVREDDNQVVEQSLVNHFKHGGINSRCEVESVNLCADHRTERAHLNGIPCQGFFPPSSTISGYPAPGYRQDAIPAMPAGLAATSSAPDSPQERARPCHVRSKGGRCRRIM